MTLKLHISDHNDDLHNTTAKRNLADGVAGLNSDTKIIFDQSRFAYEKYINHLGNVDNFMEVITAGNGTAVEDTTNHEMDLQGGISLVGHGLFQTKKSWTLSSKPIVLNFIINNFTNGVGGNKLYAGLRANFTNSSNIIAGCGFMMDTNGDIWSYCASGSVWNRDAITVNNGDLLTIIATNISVKFYKNGILQTERFAPYIPSGPLHAGACSLTFIINCTVTGNISLDSLEIIKYL